MSRSEKCHGEFLVDGCCCWRRRALVLIALVYLVGVVTSRSLCTRLRSSSGRCWRHVVSKRSGDENTQEQERTSQKQRGRELLLQSKHDHCHAIYTLSDVRSHCACLFLCALASQNRKLESLIRKAFKSFRVELISLYNKLATNIYLYRHFYTPSIIHIQDDAVSASSRRSTQLLDIAQNSSTMYTNKKRINHSQTPSGSSLYLLSPLTNVKTAV